MALPVEIVGLEIATDNLSHISQPFISSAGNVYVFGAGSTDSLLRAFKATDPTDSFANAGSDITVTSGLAINGLDAAQAGDVIHVVTTDGSSSTTMDLRYHTFNMATDAWVVTNEEIVSDYDVDLVATGTCVGISLRSDGDVIVIYNGPEVTITLPRQTVYYARREGGSWTVNVEISNAGTTSWYASGVVVGASDRHHFFFIDDGASDAYQRRLNSSNAMQTFPASYETSINSTQLATVQQGCSYDSAGTIKVRFPIQDASAAAVECVNFDSADTPSISLDTDITGALAPESCANRCAMSADETTLYHLFCDTANDYNYTVNSNSAGWGSNTLIAALTSANGIRSNVYTRAGRVVLAMVYNNSSDPWYNEIDLRAGTVLSISGSFGVTLAAATLAAAGKVALAGVGSKTLAAATLTGAGKAAISAAFSTTLATVTVAGTGRAIVTGAFSTTLATVTIEGTGTVEDAPVTGSLTAVFGTATLAGTGSVADVAQSAGSLVATFGTATLAATGTVTDPVSDITGDRAITLATATVAATGAVAVAGAAGTTLDDVTVAATGTNLTDGFGGMTLDPATVAATGTVMVTGTAGTTLDDATVAGSGSVTDGPVFIGTRNVTLDTVAMAATGMLGPAPSVPAPAVSTDSGGSGAYATTRMGMRKKFRVPDPDIEPQRTLEDILGPVKLPARKREKVIPPTPVKSLPMAAVLAGAPPTATVQKASSLPKPSPVVEDEEEYSDEDLMHLILMLIP